MRPSGSARTSQCGTFLAALLLLVFWGTRISALEALPLHTDEGLHLTRAVEVWNGHPFWEIGDGKIINHWMIALFYPQHAPVFTARIATVLVVLPGLAAAYALARRLYGPRTALLALLFWIATPYAFFYERLAQSDIEAGALVVVTLWASMRMAASARFRDALLAGVALSSAALFKISAAPFALMVVLIALLWGRKSPYQRITSLLIISAVVAASFAVPILYLSLTGRGGFGIALGWLSSGGGDSGGALFAFAGQNVARLLPQFSGETAVAWGVGILLGLVGLLIARAPAGSPRGTNGLLLAAGLLPLAPMILLSRTIEPRHFGVGLPVILVLAGMGWGGLLERLPFSAAWRWGAVAALILVLLAGFVPFARTAYTQPGGLALPPQMARQFLTDHSAGFGLREAVLDFPNTVGVPGVMPIRAAMYGDSCRRANFYDTLGYDMFCGDYPTTAELQLAMRLGTGAVYVLQDTRIPGLRPLEISTFLDMIARYPRPGETAETASVVLWQFGRPRDFIPPVVPDCHGCK